MTNMQDWNAYRDALLERVGDFAKLSPGVTRGLHTIETGAAKTKRLDPKIHEMPLPPCSLVTIVSRSSDRGSGLTRSHQPQVRTGNFRDAHPTYPHVRSRLEAVFVST
jgi:hypothetical protein